MRAATAVRPWRHLSISPQESDLLAEVAILGLRGGVPLGVTYNLDSYA
jgi:hypothetical protein